MIIYNKLVRDNIPEIIEKSGAKYGIKTLSEDEYRKALNTKLAEEVEEYLESGELDELADIEEVVITLAKLNGHTREELETVRENKREKRGGFDKRILLEYTD